MSARPKTSLWLPAIMRSAAISGVNGVLIRRGDPDAGGVLIILRARAGLAVFSQSRSMDGTLCWLQPTGPDAVSEQTAQAYIERRLNSDPDLWVVEFETAYLTLPFNQAELGF